MVALLLVLSLGVFVLLYLAPGSVEAAILGEAVRDVDAREAVRQEYGLDQPLYAQYLRWLENAVALDLGTSTRSGERVTELLGSAAGVSLQLISMAFVITVLIGVPLGVLAAVRAGSSLDRGLTAFATIGTATPTFVIGIVLLWLFGVELQLFPIFGVGEGFAGRIYHLALPAAALALHLIALLMKVTRTAMLDTLNKDYVGFARSRGLGGFRVLRRYAFRNAAIPVLTAAGLLVSALVSQMILVEVTFGLPGLGLLLIQSIEFKDVQVVQGIALISAAIVIVVNLVVDLAYSAIDPRIRIGGVRA